MEDNGWWEDLKFMGCLLFTGCWIVGWAGFLIYAFIAIVTSPGGNPWLP